MLVTVGLERLANAYLLGGHVSELFIRLLVGVLCMLAGGVLGLTQYLASRSRR